MPAPGLTLSHEPQVSHSTVTLGNQPPASVWNTIATTDVFQTNLEQAIQKLTADARQTQAAGLLYDLGVTALDGAYARVIANLTRDLADEHADYHPLHGPVEADRHPLVEQAHQLTSEFGSPDRSIIGWHAPLDQLTTGPLQVFDLADETPTLQVRVTDDFLTRRADQRRTICRDILAPLSQVFDIRLLGTGRQQRHLLQLHREHLPASVSNPSTERPTTGDDVEATREHIGHSGREVSILRHLQHEDSHTLPYSALYSLCSVGNSRVRQCLSVLANDLGLITTFERPAGKFAELTKHGQNYLKHLTREIGQQARLDGAFGNPDSGVSGTPNSRNDSRVTKAAEGCPPDSRSRGRTTPGPVEVAYMSRWNHAAATSAPPENGIGIADHPMPPKPDCREPVWSYDPDADHMVVGAEYANPMQYWVCVALALTSEKTWRQALPVDRLDDDGSLGGLVLDDVSLLRDSRCLGYLKDADADAESYIGALRKARDELREMTRDLAYENYDARNRFRGDILRAAHGLTGTMIHLLDLAGVDVTREVRFPGRFSRRFDEDAREDIVETLATGVAIQSRYGHFAAYRQLFESRGEKQPRVSPTVDAADPFGQLVGQVSLVGDGVSMLADDLRDRLSSSQGLREDAPEFGVRVRVQSDTPRQAVAETVRHVCRAKGIRMSRDAVSVCHAFTDSTYAVAVALNALQSEETARQIRLDEVRYALGSLPSDVLVPSIAPSARKIVSALMSSSRPLSQAEVCDRADVSAQSFRNHRDRLAAFDLLRPSPDGWRVSLPNPETERGERTLPWYAVEDGDALPSLVREVVSEAAIGLCHPDRLGDPEDAVYRAGLGDLDGLLSEWEWLPGYLSIVEALTATTAPDGDSSVSVIGPSPAQTALDTADSCIAP